MTLANKMQYKALIKGEQRYYIEEDVKTTMRNIILRFVTTKEDMDFMIKEVGEELI